MLKIKKKALELLSLQHFDSLAVGVIDFKANSFESFEISAIDIVSSRAYLYFDLASITKVLTNSAIYLKQPELFDEKLKWLINHQAGLMSGGRLSSNNWREQIMSYNLKKSPTEYSDYSSLRCMLELEKKTGKRLKDLCSFYFDPELMHWLDLPENSFSPETGIRNRKIISGQVHDDNCFMIHDFVSHAGLFSTVNGLSQSLLNLEEKTSMIAQIKDAYKIQSPLDRYIQGFDRVTNVNETLAGKGCSEFTFGHTGFTGTSFWIDIEKMRGAVILSNATQSYWYDRSGLTNLRKEIGSLIWSL